MEQRTVTTAIRFHSSSVTCHLHPCPVAATPTESARSAFQPDPLSLSLPPVRVTCRLSEPPGSPVNRGPPPLPLQPILPLSKAWFYFYVGEKMEVMQRVSSLKW
ncbi:hypothetical protein L1987_09255 [Smallanthus sonchifolius]|uniref:Uncharacterized protein n=1 Tax=Smallanthus sonchifolius TaxID=185202 RepID=A0ACB9JPC4_9ASTR|nr:hypothetical protein L1987_09255 [Smallanthus sonchifolius]